MPPDIRNRLIYRIHDRELLRAAQGRLCGRLVDIGCGQKPYEGLLAPLVREHVGLDHATTMHPKDGIDLLGTAYAIPVEPDAFDSAVCTAVLEHLEDPELAIRECFRVLRPGGFAIYTVPFIWHLHEEPRDFFRFTKYGLMHLFGKVGFQVVEIRALSGFWVTFGTLLSYNLARLNRGPIRWLRLLNLVVVPMQEVAAVLDRLDRTEQWTWMYLLVARKP